VAAGYRYVEACNRLRIKGKEKGGQERIRRVSGDTQELPIRILNFELKRRKDDKNFFIAPQTFF
jgi:hypothetical protein